MYVRMHSPGNLRSFDDEPRNQRDKRCTFSLRTLAAQRIRQKNTLQHTEVNSRVTQLFKRSRNDVRVAHTVHAEKSHLTSSTCTQCVSYTMRFHLVRNPRRVIKKHALSRERFESEKKRRTNFQQLQEVVQHNNNRSPVSRETSFEDSRAQETRSTDGGRKLCPELMSIEAEGVQRAGRPSKLADNSNITFTS